MSDHGTDEIRDLPARAMSDAPDPRPWADVEDRARPFDAPTPPRRRRVVWLAAAACTIALVGGLVAVIRPDDAPAAPTTTDPSTQPSWTGGPSDPGDRARHQ